MPAGGSSGLGAGAFPPDIRGRLRRRKKNSAALRAAGRENGMTLRKIAALLTALAFILGRGCAMAEFAEKEWYAEALAASEMAMGSNVRLKQVIERARAGEHITLATIGGSVTEGAGASSYAECWASRVAVRLGNEFGTGHNVELINAGVGGTASTFGYMRYQRDIVERVSTEDPDGYPDLVIVEYSVNDWQEPTGHRCYESMVRDILAQPNRPAVILLFAVFKNGWNLQEELRRIGDQYDLMMVSIRDGIYPHIGKEIPAEEFFHDEYHPTSVGHRIMADCLMRAISDAAAAEASAADVRTDAPAVYGADFIGLKTIYAGQETEGITVEPGGFSGTDPNTYRNHPVGQVSGQNFFRESGGSTEPLRISGGFSKCLIAWKASNDAAFGTLEISVDGKTVMELKGAASSWNQSEVALALDEAEPGEHIVEIRVKELAKRGTVTAVAVR